MALLFCCGTLNYADRTAMSSVFPLLQRDLGLTDLALGAVGSFFLWSYAIGSPLAGLFADRFSRGRLIVFSLTAWSAVMALTGCVANAQQLFLTRVLLGLSECFYLPAAIALISEHHPVETRATAMGIHLAALNFGMVMGGVLGGYLGETVGWRIMTFVLGGTGLLLALVAKFVIRPAVPPTDSAATITKGTALRESMLGLFRVPTYGILLVTAALISISTWMFSNWLPLYYKETFNLSLSAAGFSGTFIIQITGTIGVLLGGVLSDRIAKKGKRRRILAQSTFYLACAPFLLAFVYSRDYVIVSLAVVFFALLRGLGMSNELPLMCEVLPSKLRATGIGLMNTTNTMAGGLGTLVAGYFRKDFGLAGVFASVSTTILLGSALLLFGFLLFVSRDLKRQQCEALLETSSSVPC
ncbi:MAG: MFS transporter [Acidobacteriales bacterium]|nr:MFS transporter [Terriglobales bacterium]